MLRTGELVSCWAISTSSTKPKIDWYLRSIQSTFPKKTRYQRFSYCIKCLNEFNLVFGSGDDDGDGAARRYGVEWWQCLFICLEHWIEHLNNHLTLLSRERVGQFEKHTRMTFSNGPLSLNYHCIYSIVMIAMAMTMIEFSRKFKVCLVVELHKFHTEHRTHFSVFSRQYERASL